MLSSPMLLHPRYEHSRSDAGALVLQKLTGSLQIGRGCHRRRWHHEGSARLESPHGKEA